jgi:hypothetical protein
MNDIYRIKELRYADRTIFVPEILTSESSSEDGGKWEAVPTFWDLPCDGLEEARNAIRQDINRRTPPAVTVHSYP